MKTTRLKVSSCFVVAIAAAAVSGTAFAQFRLPGGLLDPKRAVTSVASKQLAPFIRDAAPVQLDPSELYPTIDALPGTPFASTPAIDAKATIAAIAELKKSTTGVVTMAPGDYAFSMRLFCMSHSRGAKAPLAFLLGPMRGKRTPAIIAMNSRAASTPYTFIRIQQTSWDIQSGIALSEFRPDERHVVDALIADYEPLLQGNTLDEIQSKWSTLSSTVGAPSLDSVLRDLGGAGQIVIDLRSEREDLLASAGDFDRMRNAFAPLQKADPSSLQSLWAVVSPMLWMRLVTTGHYGDIGTIQIRVGGTTPASVPLVSSIGYGRCTPAVNSSTSNFACTQPLSFEPLKAVPTN